MIQTTRPTEGVPQGVVEYVVTDDETGERIIVTHTMSSVTIESDRGGIRIPVPFVNEVLKAVATATGAQVVQPL